MPQRSILVFPYWRDNPYLNLTYLASEAARHAVDGPVLLETLLEKVGDLGDGDVLHLHWTSPICQSVEDPGEARERLDAFERAVLDLKGRGGRLLWTVHNRLPHEMRHHDLELELIRFVVDRADRIHVMAPDTADVVADAYTLPAEKVVVIPHPSYHGVYPPGPDKAAARTLLGADPDLPAVLFFGQMRTYKGLDTLLAAAGRAHASGARFQLLLAGSTPENEVDRLEQLLPAGVPTVRHHEFVDDADVSTWFAAADLVVFPYTRILNSGSIHLAATLGTPCVVPGEPHIRTQFAAEDWLHFYDPDDPVESLAQVIARAGEIGSRPHGALAFSLERSPYAISEQFEELVRSL